MKFQECLFYNTHSTNVIVAERGEPAIQAIHKHSAIHHDSAKKNNIIQVWTGQLYISACD